MLENVRFDEEEVQFKKFENNNFELPAPAVFDLPNPIIKNNEIMTPVADDLAGCALILETLKSLKDIKTQYSFRGIFSRAEEVGLYGARLIANSLSLIHI